jgi:peptidylprolyl isomerase
VTGTGGAGMEMAAPPGVEREQEAAMSTAKRGDKVRLHYTGKLGSGVVFDSTEHASEEVFRNFNGRGVAFAPAELVIGSGEFPPDFEEAIVGMAPGQLKSFVIPMDRAFGPRDPALVVAVDRDDVAPREQGTETFRVAEGRHRPNLFNPRVGDVVEVKNPDARIFPARVVALGEATITLDANHPLAGSDLHFDVRLVSVEGESA